MLLSNPEYITTSNESLITNLEHLNGIYTQTQRTLEASLLVDPHFLYPAILEGQTSGLELAFGEEAWIGHLKARHFARAYNGPLTRDFILQIYSILSEKPAEDIVTDIKFDGGPIGIGAEGDGTTFVPMRCTPEQLEAIHYNPYVEWLWLAHPRHSNSHPLAPYLYAKTGWRIAEKFDGVGCINYIYKLRNEKMRELDEICVLYNTWEEREGLKGEASYHRENSQALAAVLQHRAVSLHAGSNFNGRASRILMNWSLERHGLAPSVPNPADIRSPRQQRIEHVQYFSNLQARARKKVMAGITDLIDIFELHHERDALVRLHTNAYLPKIPPRLEPGKLHDPQKYKKYLLALGASTLLSG